MQPYRYGTVRYGTVPRDVACVTSGAVPVPYGTVRYHTLLVFGLCAVCNCQSGIETVEVRVRCQND